MRGEVCGALPPDDNSGDSAGSGKVMSNDSVTEVLSASRTLLSDLSGGGGGLGGMDGGGGSGGVEVPAPQISGSSSSLRTEAQSLLDTLGDQRAAARRRELPHSRN